MARINPNLVAQLVSANHVRFRDEEHGVIVNKSLKDLGEEAENGWKEIIANHGDIYLADENSTIRVPFESATRLLLTLTRFVDQSTEMIKSGTESLKKVVDGPDVMDEELRALLSQGMKAVAGEFLPENANEHQHATWNRDWTALLNDEEMRSIVITVTPDGTVGMSSKGFSPLDTARLLQTAAIQALDSVADNSIEVPADHPVVDQLRDIQDEREDG